MNFARSMAVLATTFVTLAAPACVTPAATPDVIDSGMDAGCASGSARVSYTPPDGYRVERCSTAVTVRFVYNSAWQPGSCRLIVAYSMASLELPEGLVLDVGGDGDLFAHAGPADGWVGVVMPCSDPGGVCRFIGTCAIEILRAGGLGENVEIALSARCSVPSETPGRAPFILNSFTVAGTASSMSQQPSLTDDAPEVDLSACQIVDP